MDFFSALTGISFSINQNGNTYETENIRKPTKQCVEDYQYPPKQLTGEGDCDFESVFENTEEDIYTFVNGKQHNFTEVGRDDDGDWYLQPKPPRCDSQHVSKGVRDYIARNALMMIMLLVIEKQPNNSTLVVPKSLFDAQDSLMADRKYTFDSHGSLFDEQTKLSQQIPFKPLKGVVSFQFEPK
jgi:hypothetical protein